MKRIIAALLMLPALAFGAANDLVVNQRNSTDTGQLTRLVAHPAGVTDGVMGYSGSTQLPVFFAYGPGLSIVSGTIDTVPVSFSAITGTPTTLSGYGITDGATLTQLATKLTTPAGTTLQYVRGDGSLATFPALSSGTVTSVTAGTGLSGGTITTSGTISLPNTGTAGTYANVTTDAQGRVTGGTSITQASATRPLNTVFQVSATRPALVSYSVQITVTASIAGGQNGDVILEIASDSGFTANVQTLAISGVGQTYTLAVALQGIQPQTSPVSGVVPAGYYARLRTVNVTGTPAFSYRAGQETLL